MTTDKETNENIKTISSEEKKVLRELINQLFQKDYMTG